MCKQLITIKFGTFLISLFPFPELLRLVKMCNILGCLYGVWKVFGRHLGSVWVTLDTVRGVQCANTHFTHFHQLIPFLPVASNYTKWAIFWGVRRVSGGCLGGVWELSEWPWILFRGVCCRLNWKKIILGHFNQLRHFLTVANFRRFRAQNAKFQVWFYIWRSPQIKKNPIETGLKIKFPVRIPMGPSYNWDQTSQWALLPTP